MSNGLKLSGHHNHATHPHINPTGLPFRGMPQSDNIQIKKIDVKKEDTPEQTLNKIMAAIDNNNADEVVVRNKQGEYFVLASDELKLQKDGKSIPLDELKGTHNIPGLGEVEVLAVNDEAEGIHPKSSNGKSVPHFGQGISGFGYGATSVRAQMSFPSYSRLDDISVKEENSKLPSAQTHISLF